MSLDESLRSFLKNRDVLNYPIRFYLYDGELTGELDIDIDSGLQFVHDVDGVLHVLLVVQDQLFVVRLLIRCTRQNTITCIGKKEERNYNSCVKYPKIFSSFRNKLFINFR